jgi:hypothetical protein
VLHDDSDGVRVRIEGGVEFVVGHLLDGPIRQTLVGLESVNDGCHEFGGDVHAVYSVCPAACAQPVLAETAEAFLVLSKSAMISQIASMGSHAIARLAMTRSK